MLVSNKMTFHWLLAGLHWGPSAVFCSLPEHQWLDRLPVWSCFSVLEKWWRKTLIISISSWPWFSLVQLLDSQGCTWVGLGGRTAPLPWGHELCGSLNTQPPDKPSPKGGNPVVRWACICVKISKCPEIYFGLIFRGTGISSSVWKSPHPSECEASDGWQARVCLSGFFKGLNACAFLYGRAKPYIYVYVYICI